MRWSCVGRMNSVGCEKLIKDSRFAVLLWSLITIETDANFFALTRYLHERTPLRMRVSNGVQLSRQSIFFSCGSDSTIRKELYSAFRPTMLSNFIVFFSSSIWFFSLPRPWTANYARLRGDERKNFINLDDIANKPNLSQFQSLLIGLVGFKPAAN